MQQQQMNPHQAMYGQQYGQPMMGYGAPPGGAQYNFMGGGMGGMMQMMTPPMNQTMMAPQHANFQMFGHTGHSGGGHGGHGGGPNRKRKQGGGNQYSKKQKK